jgi:hypothetical protein
MKVLNDLNETIEDEYERMNILNEMIENVDEMVNVLMVNDENEMMNVIT